MKWSSEHLSNLIICLSCINYLSSASTLSRRCSGTLLPFCWTGLKFSFIVGFAMWFLDFSSLVHRLGYFFSINFMMFVSVVLSVIWSIFLPSFFLQWEWFRVFEGCLCPLYCWFCCLPGRFCSLVRTTTLNWDPFGARQLSWFLYCWKIWIFLAPCRELSLLLWFESIGLLPCFYSWMFWESLCLPAMLFLCCWLTLLPRILQDRCCWGACSSVLLRLETS